MKIEKLSDNKLKFIFSITEFEKEKLDYHSFMAGSLLFDNIIDNLLYIAKNELNFDTNDCNTEIQTFEFSKGNFIIIITKYQKNQKKLKAKRKQGKFKNSFCLFEFYNFDDYCEFTLFLAKKFGSIYKTFISNSKLYNLNNKYILSIDGFALAEKEFKIFNALISEFAIFKSDSNTLLSKLKECNS